MCVSGFLSCRPSSWSRFPPGKWSHPRLRLHLLQNQPHQVSPHSVPHLSQASHFSGESGDCKTLITQHEIHFELQPDAFPCDRAKVAYIINQLTGRAEAWTTPKCSWTSPVCQTLAQFSKALTQIFQHMNFEHEAAKALSGLVVDYAVEFRTMAAKSSWNPPSSFRRLSGGLIVASKGPIGPAGPSHGSGLPHQAGY